MPRYAAFLRAINVGGHVVKMDALRTLMTGAGIARVETFIASRNVLFESPSRSGAALERRIEEVLEQGLGYRVATFVRTMPELAASAERQPFSDVGTPGVSVYVGFLKASPDAPRLRTLLSLRSAVNDFTLEGRELYWRLRGPFSDAGVSGASIEKALGLEATLRNVTTVRKLAARALG